MNQPQLKRDIYVAFLLYKKLNNAYQEYLFAICKPQKHFSCTNTLETAANLLATTKYGHKCKIDRGTKRPVNVRADVKDPELPKKIV